MKIEQVEAAVALDVEGEGSRAAIVRNGKVLNLAAARLIVSVEDDGQRAVAGVHAAQCAAIVGGICNEVEAAHSPHNLPVAGGRAIGREAAFFTALQIKCIEVDLLAGNGFHGENGATVG